MVCIRCGACHDGEPMRTWFTKRGRNPDDVKLCATCVVTAIDDLTEDANQVLLVPGLVSLPENELRCSCDQEQGDSECARHPTCGECGRLTTHPVGTCELHAPLDTARSGFEDGGR